MRRIIYVLILSGCSGGVALESRTFDLGLEAPGAQLPAVRIASVRAIAPFEATDMQYRLAYRNAAEIAAFANSRWAAAPAEMMRKQLLRAASDGSGKCILEIEMQEFSQVFAAKEASEARIEMRVGLSSGSKALTKQFTVIESNAGPDAVSGAAAFARAANRAIGELGGWISAQADCR
jgi:cholesterol transport system auxiliary component